MPTKSKIDDSNFGVLVPEEYACHTLDGTELKIKKPNWGKEIKISKIVANIQKQFPSDAIVMKGEDTAINLAKVIPVLLESCPEKFSEIMAILMDKDVKWVNENLDITGITEVMIPFFQRYSTVLQKVVGKFTVETQKLAK